MCLFCFFERVILSVYIYRSMSQCSRFFLLLFFERERERGKKLLVIWRLQYEKYRRVNWMCLFNKWAFALTPTLPRRELGSLYCAVRIRMISVCKLSVCSVRQAFLGRRKKNNKIVFKSNINLYHHYFRQSIVYIIKLNVSYHALDFFCIYIYTRQSMNYKIRIDNIDRSWRYKIGRTCHQLT